MRASINFSFCVVAALLLFLAPACRKAKVTTEQNKNKEEGTTIEVDASKYGTFACINFATGEVKDMTHGDAKNVTSWDLAVSTFFFKTNSGASGPGKGGAFLTKTEETKDIKLEDYKTLPTEEQWVVDAESVWQSTPNNGMAYGEFTETGISPVLTSQFENQKDYFFSKVKHFGLFTYYNMPPKERLEEAIFFVRCADGKVARCRVNYADKAYHYKISYIYDVK